MEKVLPSNPKKEPMEAEMHISQVYEKIEKSFGSLLWPIKEYHDLEPDVYHVYPADEINGYLSVMKTDDFLKINLKSDDLKGDIICSLLRHDKKIVSSVLVTEIASGDFDAIFSLSVINNLESDLLKEGCVLVHFKFNEKPEVRRAQLHNVAACGEPGRLRLKEDLQSASMRPKFANFTIKATNGRKISVPKALLAAQSGFFKEFGERDSVELDVDYVSLCGAVRYLYTGDLSDSRDYNNICQLLAIAEVLKIKRLQSRCSNLIQDISKQM